jgi:hypothetical protein
VRAILIKFHGYPESIAFTGFPGDMVALKDTLMDEKYISGTRFAKVR